MVGTIHRPKITSQQFLLGVITVTYINEQLRNKQYLRPWQANLNQMMIFQICKGISSISNQVLWLTLG